MDCAELNEMLDQLMDDALTEEQRQQMVAHGRDCPECAEAIRRTMQLKALMSQMEDEVAVPLEAQARWRGAVRQAAQQRKRSRLIRWIGTAAAALVVLGGAGWALSVRNAPSPMQNAAVMELDEAVAGAGAVVEADGGVVMQEAAEITADEDVAVFEEKQIACAALEQAPACEVTLRVGDVDTACGRIADLVAEYEGDADVQRLEDGGANVFLALTAEDAQAFLSAVLPMDEGDQAPELPKLPEQGEVLVLLTVLPL